jgi:catechol 2,3-dioxygenase-like lactoylglutathione lyase family enzyme
MAIDARFGHVNIIAADWRQLAAFYQTVFGCVPVPPERNLSGDALERGTGIAQATLTGVHLRLPGHGDNGPTLEIFTYGLNDTLVPGPPNRTGMGHIAFIVTELEAARQAVLQAGGSQHGALVTTSAGAKRVSWIYMRDPEGNLLELQAWHE